MKNIKSIIKKWVIPIGYLELIGKFRQKKAVLSSEDKELLLRSNTLFNRHVNKRCFILGAGSSVKSQDLRKLQGEIVISVSNTFVHPDYHIFKPKYHVLPALIASHGHLGETDEKHILWLKEMERRTFDAEIFFHIGDRYLIESNNLFSDRNIYWNEYVKWDEQPVTDIDLAKVPSIWSVSEYALTVALYMGFKEIYLIGFDHDWFNGPLVYFYDEKKDHIMQPDKERLSFADSEFQMLRHAKIFKKYKYLYALKKNIYNANANTNHYLDVFPKVEYESLFSN